MIASTRAAVVHACLALLAAGAACAGSKPSQTGEPRYTIVKPAEEQSETGGISPEKQEEIQLVLQNREPSARKCYQDVLNERHDRKFEGLIRVVITLGTGGQAQDVKVIANTLQSPEVEGCLVEKIKEWEFPSLAQPGEVQYEYRFRPAF